MITATKLNRTEALEKFIKAYGLDITKFAKNIRVKTVEYKEGGLQFAPEQYCYKITFKMHGQSNRLAFWPNTVGYQGY
jgi:hypothetical protein